MAVFKNKFFSKAGQKERVTNVKNVLSVAITGKVKGEKANLVTAKGKRNLLTKAAERPFLTAGVVAGGITAAGYKIGTQAIVSKGSTSLLKLGTSRGLGSIGTYTASSGLKKGLVAGAIGLGAGALLFGGKQKAGAGGSGIGGGSEIITEQTPQQKTDIFQDPRKQDTGYLEDQFSGSAGRDLFFTTKKRLNQDQYTTTYALPYQAATNTPTSSGGEGTGGVGGSTGTDWTMIALIAGAVYLLSRGE